MGAHRTGPDAQDLAVAKIAYFMASSTAACLKNFVSVHPHHYFHHCLGTMFLYFRQDNCHFGVWSTSTAGGELPVWGRGWVIIISTNAGYRESGGSRAQ